MIPVTKKWLQSDVHVNRFYSTSRIKKELGVLSSFHMESLDLFSDWAPQVS